MRSVRCLGIIVVSVLFAAAVAAMEFSADVVSATANGKVSGKMYVGKDMVRMEMGPSTVINRIDKKVSWILMPATDMYMEQPIDVTNYASTSYTIPGEIERKEIGKDTFDGRPVTKYLVTYSYGNGKDKIVQWMDAEGFMVKSADEDGSWSIEYRNIKKGAQDPKLFELPEGYKKFAMPSMGEDMAAMMQK